MSITSIEKQSVSNEVFLQMKEMIMSGEWAPGEKIPSENDLKEQFGVSRVTIREALKKLNSYGVTETAQGKGTFIKTFGTQGIINPMLMTMFFKTMDERAIRDMMEFRGIIETESAALAAERATEEDVEFLKQNYKRMIDSRNDIRSFAKRDLEFHMYISKMTKNMVLIELSSVIWEFIREHFAAVVTKVGTEKGIYYHGEILKGIMKKDAAMTRALMVEHLNNATQGFFQNEE